MNHETLHRLLIDRNLGELPEDASVLLDEFLALNPEAAQAASEIDHTLKLARSSLTMSPAAELPLPPLDPNTIAAAAHKSSTPRAWSRRMLLAASLLAAFWLSGRVFTTTPPPSARIGSQPEVATLGESDESGFWSVSRLSRQHPGELPGAQPAVQWNSPVSRPHLGVKS